MPAITIIAIIYVAAFWNNSGFLGLPSRALKSAISQDTISERDQSSNVYRLIENYNIGYTIRQNPLTGVGFGNVFKVVIPMPDISFYLWWNYFPHNSIIYLWVKAGAGGFLAMLYLIGITISCGARAVIRTNEPDTKAVLVTALMFVVMHFMFSYVDIAWDSQSMLYLGCAMGMINSIEYILGLPEDKKKKRYPWQADPKPKPYLVALPDSLPQ
jgi:O-antigen ligase